MSFMAVMLSGFRGSRAGYALSGLSARSFTAIQRRTRSSVRMSCFRSSITAGFALKLIWSMCACDGRAERPGVG